MEIANKMKKQILKLGDIIELYTTAIGQKGDGIAFYDGMAIIIPNAQLNITYNVKITSLYSKYAFGMIVR